MGGLSKGRGLEIYTGEGDCVLSQIAFRNGGKPRHDLVCVIRDVTAGWKQWPPSPVQYVGFRSHGI